MGQRNPVMKVISSAVVFAFTVTSLGITPNTFASASLPIPEVSSLTAVTLAIPAELGQVTDSITGDPTAPSFIHIQSAHGNYQAEKNIEKLLAYIEKNSSVKLMLLEGAANKLQPELFRIFPKQPDFNRKVTDKLMQEGYLTGPESFLIESANKTEGWGIEDLVAYKKDRDAFISVVKSNKTAQAFLLKLRARIDKRFASKLNKDLLNLVRREEAYGSGTVSFEGWLKTLGEFSKKYLMMDLSDAFYQDKYPFLIRYFRLQTIGSKIDRDKARLEANAFLNELVHRKVSKEILGNFKAILQLPEAELLKTVNRTTDGYSILRRAFDVAFEKLPKDFPIKAWPNWTLYAQYIILMQEMEGKGLHEEADRLKEKLQTTLAKTADEKEYLAVSRRLYLLRRIFSLELTRPEYEELTQTAKTTDVQGIQEIFKTAMDFYSTAVDRENKMFQNALQRMSLQKQDRAVIVTGGFHAEGLKNLAASRNFSYIQITPRIAEVSKRDHEVYLKAMLGARDFATSQAVPLLGVNPIEKRVFVTGPEQTQAWRSEIRSLIDNEINSEDVPARPDLKLASAKSVFGSSTSSSAPGMARSEMRESVLIEPDLQRTFTELGTEVAFFDPDSLHAGLEVTEAAFHPDGASKIVWDRIGDVVMVDGQRRVFGESDDVTTLGDDLGRGYKERNTDREVFVLPNGNLGFNNFYIGVTNGKVYYHQNDPLTARTMFVKRKQVQRPEAMKVAFQKQANGMVRVLDPKEHGKDITDEIEMAIYGLPLVKPNQEGHGEANLGELFDQLDDLRHWARFPMFRFKNRRQSHLGMSDDVGSFYRDPEARTRLRQGLPVTLSLDPVLRKGVTFDEVKQVYDAWGYKGRYTIDEERRTITAVYEPGTHPHSYFGMTEDGKWFVGSEKGGEEGLQTHFRGISLKKLADDLIKKHKAKYVWLWANGKDVALRPGNVGTQASGLRESFVEALVFSRPKMPASHRSEMRIPTYTAGEVIALSERAINVLKEREVPGAIKGKISEITSDRIVQDRGVTYLPKVEGGELLVIGDLHGDWATLETILRQYDVENRLARGEPLYVVFLGDFSPGIDQQTWVVDGVVRFLKLLTDHPDRVLAVRGNHDERESAEKVAKYLSQTPPMKALHYEVMAKYGQEAVYDSFMRFFDALPTVLVTGNRMVLAHGAPPASPVNSLRHMVGNAGLQQAMMNNTAHDPEAMRFSFYYRGMLISREAFDRFMDAVGGLIYMSGHEEKYPPFRPRFAKRFETILSHGPRRPNTPPSDESAPFQARFAVLPLDREMTQIPEDATHLVSQEILAEVLSQRGPLAPEAPVQDNPNRTMRTLREWLAEELHQGIATLMLVGPGGVPHLWDLIQDLRDIGIPWFYIGPSIQWVADEAREIFERYPGQTDLEERLIPLMISGPSMVLVLELNRGSAVDLIRSRIGEIIAKYSGDMTAGFLHSPGTVEELLREWNVVETSVEKRIARSEIRKKGREPDKLKAEAKGQRVGSDNEWVDEVDVQDRIMGKVSRFDIRNSLKPIRYRAAHVFAVTEDGRILLQRRAYHKTGAGFLDASVAGAVLAGETGLQAAVREGNEELPFHFEAADLLQVRPDASRNVFDYRTPWKWENRNLFLMRLTPERLAAVERKNVELTTFWDAVYPRVSEQLHVSVEQLKAMAKKGEDGVREAIRTEMIRQVGVKKLKYYEADRFEMLPLSQIYALHEAAPSAQIGNGVYGYFESQKNQSPDAAAYRKAFEQALMDFSGKDREKIRSEVRLEEYAWFNAINDKRHKDAVREKVESIVRQIRINDTAFIDFREMLGSEEFGRITDREERMELLDKFVEIIQKIPGYAKEYSQGIYDVLGALLFRKILWRTPNRKERIELLNECFEIVREIYSFAGSGSRDAARDFLDLFDSEGFLRLMDTQEREKVLKIARKIPVYAELLSDAEFRDLKKALNNTWFSQTADRGERMTMLEIMYLLCADKPDLIWKLEESMQVIESASNRKELSVILYRFSTDLESAETDSKQISAADEAYRHILLFADQCKARQGVSSSASKAEAQPVAPGDELWMRTSDARSEIRVPMELLKEKIAAAKEGISKIRQEEIEDKTFDGSRIGQANAELFESTLQSIMEIRYPDHKKDVAVLSFGSVARRQMLTYSDGDIIVLSEDVTFAKRIIADIQSDLVQIGLKNHKIHFHPWSAIADLTAKEKGHLSSNDIDLIEGATFVWGAPEVFEKVKGKALEAASGDWEILLQRFLYSELYFAKTSADQQQKSSGRFEPNLKYSNGYLRDLLDKIYRWPLYMGQRRDLGLPFRGLIDLMETEYRAITHEEHEKINKAEGLFLFVRDALHRLHEEEVDILNEKDQRTIEAEMQIKEGELEKKLQESSNLVISISRRLWTEALEHFATLKGPEWKASFNRIRGEMAGWDIDAQKKMVASSDPGIRLAAAWYASNESVLVTAWEMASKVPLARYTILNWTVMAAIALNPHTSRATLEKMRNAMPQGQPEWLHMEKLIQRHPNWSERDGRSELRSIDIERHRWLADVPESDEKTKLRKIWNEIVDGSDLYDTETVSDFNFWFTISGTFDGEASATLSPETRIRALEIIKEIFSYRGKSSLAAMMLFRPLFFGDRLKSSGVLSEIAKLNRYQELFRQHFSRELTLQGDVREAIVGLTRERGFFRAASFEEQVQVIDKLGEIFWAISAVEARHTNPAGSKRRISPMLFLGDLLGSRTGLSSIAGRESRMKAMDIVRRAIPCAGGQYGEMIGVFFRSFIALYRDLGHEMLAGELERIVANTESELNSVEDGDEGALRKATEKFMTRFRLFGDQISARQSVADQNSSPQASLDSGRGDLWMMPKNRSEARSETVVGIKFVTELLRSVWDHPVKALLVCTAVAIGCLIYRAGKASAALRHRLNRFPNAVRAIEDAARREGEDIIDDEDIKIFKSEADGARCKINWNDIPDAKLLRIEKAIQSGQIPVLKVVGGGQELRFTWHVYRRGIVKTSWEASIEIEESSEPPEARGAETERLLRDIAALRQHGIVLVGGPTAGGKSMLIDRIRDAVQALGRKAVVVSVDNYLKLRAHIPIEEGRFQFDHPDAYDRETAFQAIRRLLRGDAVVIPPPFYDRDLPPTPVSLGERDILILEGIHVLGSEFGESLKPYLKDALRVYVDAPDELRFLRRLDRDLRVRELEDPHQVLTVWMDATRQGEQFVVPTRQNAGYVIHQNGDDEIAALDRLTREYRSQLRARAVALREDAKVQFLDRVERFIQERSEVREIMKRLPAVLVFVGKALAAVVAIPAVVVVVAGFVIYLMADIVTSILSIPGWKNDKELWKLYGFQGFRRLSALESKYALDQSWYKKLSAGQKGIVAEAIDKAYEGIKLRVSLSDEFDYSPSQGRARAREEENEARENMKQLLRSEWVSALSSLDQIKKIIAVLSEIPEYQQNEYMAETYNYADALMGSEWLRRHPGEFDRILEIFSHLLKAQNDLEDFVKLITSGDFAGLSFGQQIVVIEICEGLWRIGNLSSLIFSDGLSRITEPAERMAFLEMLRILFPVWYAESKARTAARSGSDDEIWNLMGALKWIGKSDRSPDLLSILRDFSATVSSLVTEAARSQCALQAYQRILHLAQQVEARLAVGKQTGPESPNRVPASEGTFWMETGGRSEIRDVRVRVREGERFFGTSAVKLALSEAERQEVSLAVDVVRGLMQQVAPIILRAREQIKRNVSLDLPDKGLHEQDGTLWSPDVTRADLEVQLFLLQELQRRIPFRFQVVAEEKQGEAGRLMAEINRKNAGARIRIIIDPIDGTRKFRDPASVDYSSLVGLSLNRGETGETWDMVAGFVLAPEYPSSADPALGTLFMASEVQGFDGVQVWGVKKDGQLVDCRIVAMDTDRKKFPGGKVSYQFRGEEPDEASLEKEFQLDLGGLVDASEEIFSAGLRLAFLATQSKTTAGQTPPVLYVNTLKPFNTHDVAAGMYLVQKAGGLVFDLKTHQSAMPFRLPFLSPDGRHVGPFVAGFPNLVQSIDRRRTEMRGAITESQANLSQLLKTREEDLRKAMVEVKVTAQEKKEIKLDLDDFMQEQKEDPKKLKSQIAILDSEGKEVRVAIIIPTDNKEAEFLTTLQSIRKDATELVKQKPNWTIEIVAALNGPDRDVAEKRASRWISTLPQGNVTVRVQYFRGAKGKAETMNQAVKEYSQSHIMGFMDDDVSVEPGALGKILHGLIHGPSVYFAGAKYKWKEEVLNDADREKFARHAQGRSSKFFEAHGLPVGRAMFLFTKTYPGIPPSVIHDDGYLRYYFMRPLKESAFDRMWKPEEGAVIRFIPTTDLEGYGKRRERTSRGSKQISMIFPGKVDIERELRREYEMQLATKATASVPEDYDEALAQKIEEVDQKAEIAGIETILENIQGKNKLQGIAVFSGDWGGDPNTKTLLSRSEKRDDQSTATGRRPEGEGGKGFRFEVRAIDLSEYDWYRKLGADEKREYEKVIKKVVSSFESAYEPDEEGAMMGLPSQPNPHCIKALSRFLAREEFVKAVTAGYGLSVLENGVARTAYWAREDTEEAINSLWLERWDWRHPPTNKKLNDDPFERFRPLPPQREAGQGPRSEMRAIDLSKYAWYRNLGSKERSQYKKAVEEAVHSFVSAYDREAFEHPRPLPSNPSCISALSRFLARDEFSKAVTEGYGLNILENGVAQTAWVAREDTEEAIDSLWLERWDSSDRYQRQRANPDPFQRFRPFPLLSDDVRAAMEKKLLSLLRQGVISHYHNGWRTLEDVYASDSNSILGVYRGVHEAHFDGDRFIAKQRVALSMALTLRGIPHARPDRQTEDALEKEDGKGARSEIRGAGEYADRQRAFYDAAIAKTRQSVQEGKVPKPETNSPVIDISLDTGFREVTGEDSDFTDELDSRLHVLVSTLTDQFPEYKSPQKGKYHMALFEMFHRDLLEGEQNPETLPPDLFPLLSDATGIAVNHLPFKVVLRGLSMGRDGTIFVKGYVKGDALKNIREEMSAKDPAHADWSDWKFFHITLGRLKDDITPARWREVLKWVEERQELELGTVMVQNPRFIAISDNHATIVNQTLQQKLQEFNAKLRSEVRGLWNSTDLGTMEYQRPGVRFFKGARKFQESDEESPVGTLIAIPGSLRVDIRHLFNAQGNLTITDRATNRRTYILGKGEVATSDTSIIRGRYLPFSIAMSESLKNDPGSEPLAWLDFSNNFGNPDHVSYTGGRVFYPTGFSGGKGFKQDLEKPLFSFIQHSDGTIEFGYVHYQVTKIEKKDDYYEEVYADAFLGKRLLSPESVIFSAIPLVVEGEPADLASAIRTGMFQDLRHLFGLPAVLNPENAKSGRFAMSEIPKEIRSGIYFGLEELSANNYEKAVQALSGPVSLSTTLSISQTQKITLTREQVRKLLASYTEETYPDRVRKRQPEEGKYLFISDKEIVIFLWPAPYPHLLVGETQKGEMFVQSIGGRTGRVGISIKETLDYAKSLGLRNLMTISQGTGSLLGYLSQSVSHEPAALERAYNTLVGASEDRRGGSAVITLMSKLRSEARTETAVANNWLPSVSYENLGREDSPLDNIAAKLLVAKEVVGNIVAIGITKLASFTSVIMEAFFPEHFQAVPVIPERVKAETPGFVRLLAESAAAIVERSVTGQLSRLPKDETEMLELLPLVTFAEQNPKVVIGLAVTGVSERDVTLLCKQLAVLNGTRTLPGNLKIQSFADVQAFRKAYDRVWNEAGNKPMAFVTDGVKAEVMGIGGRNGRLLRVTANSKLLDLTVAMMKSAVAILDARFVDSHKNGFLPMTELGVQGLMAELTNFIAAQARMLASA